MRTCRHEFPLWNLHKKPVMAACVCNSSIGGQRQAGVPRPGSIGKTTCFQFRERPCLKIVREKAIEENTGVLIWLPDESPHPLPIPQPIMTIITLNSLSLEQAFHSQEVSILSAYSIPMLPREVRIISCLGLWVVEVMFASSFFSYYVVFP